MTLSMQDLPASNSPASVGSAAVAQKPTSMRENILRAAAHLFRHRGYHGTTIRAISENVGILSGSLFHYFESKERILLEIMHEAAISMCTSADVVAAADRSPIARLRGLIILQLECLLEVSTGDLFAVLISEWREVNASDKVPLTAFRKRYFAAWNKVLEDCAQMNVLRTEPHATLFALHGAINWANTWYQPTGRLTVPEYARLLERMALTDTAAADRSGSD